MFLGLEEDIVDYDHKIMYTIIMKLTKVKNLEDLSVRMLERSVRIGLVLQACGPQFDPHNPFFKKWVWWHLLVIPEL